MLYDEKCLQCLHYASSVGCQVFLSKLSAFLYMYNNIVQLETEVNYLNQNVASGWPV